jgi:hypothetical protein
VIGHALQVRWIGGPQKDHTDRVEISYLFSYVISTPYPSSQVLHVERWRLG